MKTYEVSAPVATHWREATCAEYECDAHQLGWKTIIDESTELGQQQAALIRSMTSPSYPNRRYFTEARDGAGMTVFTFPPGQACFRKHYAPLERPPLLLVRGGDWRGNPRVIETVQHTRPEFWVEDFAEHQGKLADDQKRG
jgi:hypothetical protein